MRHSQLRYLHLLGITHCHTLFELKLHILAWTFSYKVSEFSGIFAPNDLRSLTKTKWCIEGTLRDQRTQHTVVYELDWGFCLQCFWYLLHKLIKKIRSLSLAKAGTAPHGAGALCSVLWRMYWGFQIGNFFYVVCSISLAFMGLNSRLTVILVKAYLFSVMFVYLSLCLSLFITQKWIHFFNHFSHWPHEGALRLKDWHCCWIFLNILYIHGIYSRK